MANEIVKYHNDMASVSFPGFSPAEHDIFAAVCFECKDKGTREQDISFEELKKRSGFVAKDDARFVRYIKELTMKLHNLVYRVDKADGGFKSFVLFTSFETVNLHTKDAALRVGVSEGFSYILNSDVANLPEGTLPLLSAGYTSFELDQHNALTSIYSKMAFRQLKRFKRTGWWQVTIEEFRRLLDIPASYRMPDINRRVLKPIMDELPEYFDNLQLEQIRNGRQVASLKFTFTPQKDPGVWTERNIKEEESVHACPFCGEPLYAIHASNGDVFYGHKDGWKKTALCSQSFSSLAELHNAIKAAKDHGYAIDEEETGPKIEKTGFKCRSCGRPLYKMYNKSGEMFYGHADGWNDSAVCRRTYSTVAEIKGYSETPSRGDHQVYDLYDEKDVVDPEARKKIEELARGMFKTFETLKDE